VRILSLLALCATLFFVGCVEYPSGLPVGSTKAQVQAILGSPKSTSRDGSLTTWNYGNGLVCVFRDGALVASNYAGGGAQPGYVGPALPPIAINVTPAPYYPAYYGGYGYRPWGWGGGYPYYGGWGGWGGYGYRNCGWGGWGGGWHGGGGYWGGRGWCR